jgi:hypothetical protein
MIRPEAIVERLTTHHAAIDMGSASHTEDQEGVKRYAVYGAKGDVRRNKLRLQDTVHRHPAIHGMWNEYSSQTCG